MLAPRHSPGYSAPAMQDCDVLILGGGPGGSTLAATLAPRGVRAIVLERERFPRFHIGESLLPKSMEVIQKLGLAEAMDQRFLRKYGARFLCSETRRVAAYRFAEAFDPTYPYAYEVQRADFDELLLRHAAARGADVREEWEARDVIFEGGRAVGVRARDLRGARGERTPEVTLRAPVVVDATGRDTFLATRTRRKATIARLDKTAFYSHYRGAFRQEGEDEGNIQIVIFEHGWFWFIPFKGELTSVGFVASSDHVRARPKGETLDAFFDRTVGLSSWATEFLAGAERLRPVSAVADYSYRIDQLAGDGWLFVGDAGGFLDPLFSTGAHLAMKGADLAAPVIERALASGDTSRAAFADYEIAIREAVDMFLGAVQGFYEGSLRELIFAESQRTAMRKLVTSMLSGDVFHPAENRPIWTGFLRGRYPVQAPTFG